MFHPAFILPSTFGGIIYNPACKSRGEAPTLVDLDKHEARGWDVFDVVG
jgi:hypothetical protein